MRKEELFFKKIKHPSLARYYGSEDRLVAFGDSQEPRVTTLFNFRRAVFALRAVALTGADFKYATVGAAREVQKVPYKIEKDPF